MLLDKLGIYKPDHKIVFFTSAVILVFSCSILAFINITAAILIPVFLVLSYLIYKNPVIAVYIMAFLLPFFGFGVSLFGYNFLFIDIFSAFAFCVVAIKTLITFLFNRSEFKMKAPLIKAFGLFFLSAVLSIINSADVCFSLIYLFRFLAFCYIVFVVLPANTVKTKQQLKNVMIVFVCSVLISFGIQFLYILKGGFQVDFRGFVSSVEFFGVYPFSSNHNLLAEVYALGLFPAIYLAYIEENKYRKFIYMMAMFVIFMANIFILSRASFLASLVGVAAIFILYPFVKENKFFKRGLFEMGFRTVIFVMLIGVLLGVFTNFLSARDEKEVDSSDESRYEMSVSSVKMFKKHPVIGNGISTFKELLSQDKEYTGKWYLVLDSHGVVQKIVAEQGVFGVMSFGLLVLTLFVIYIKAIKNIKSLEDRTSLTIIFGMLVCALFMQLFNTTYYTHRMWFPIGIYVSAIYVFAGDVKVNYFKKETVSKLNKKCQKSK